MMPEPLPANRACRIRGLSIVTDMGLLWWRQKKPAEKAKLPGPRIDRDAVVGALRANDFIFHAGTPRCHDSGWHGILLNAPRRIIVRPQPRDPMFGDDAPRALIWGHCLFPDRPGEGHSDYRTDITLVAVEITKGQVYRGRVTERPTFGSVHCFINPQRPALPADSATGRLTSSGGPFNPNLLAICGLPCTDADYEIFALLGTWRSNVIDVSLRFELGN